MLRARRRSSMTDGLVCRDRLEQVGDSLARSVRVERVDAGSAAGQAGLQAGDVLVQIGDVPILCSYDVERALLDNRAGDRVRIVVRRQNAEQRLDLTLAAPDRAPNNTSDLVWHKLGLQLNPVDADLVTRVNRQLHGGMEVVAVNADSPAARAGIKKGDILVGLHQWETVTLENVAYVLGHPDLPGFTPLNFYILRGGQVRRGSLPGMN
jgi:serine protease Do